MLQAVLGKMFMMQCEAKKSRSVHATCSLIPLGGRAEGCARAGGKKGRGCLATGAEGRRRREGEVTQFVLRFPLDFLVF